MSELVVLLVIVVFVMAISKEFPHFEKNCKKYDLLGQLSQKIENSMSRFCALIALGSTNTPVVLRISPLGFSKIRAGP